MSIYENSAIYDAWEVPNHEFLAEFVTLGVV